MKGKRAKNYKQRTKDYFSNRRDRRGEKCQSIGIQEKAEIKMLRGERYEVHLDNS